MWFTWHCCTAGVGLWPVPELQKGTQGQTLLGVTTKSLACPVRWQLSQSNEVQNKINPHNNDTAHLGVGFMMTELNWLKGLVFLSLKNIKHHSVARAGDS